MNLIDKVKAYLYSKKYKVFSPVVSEKFEKIDDLKVVKIRFVEHITMDEGICVSALCGSDEYLGIVKMNENNTQGLELSKNKLLPNMTVCMNRAEYNHYLKENYFAMDEIVPLKNVLKQYQIENHKDELSKTEIKDLLEVIKLKHYGVKTNNKCHSEEDNVNH